MTFSMRNTLVLGPSFPNLDKKEFSQKSASSLFSIYSPLSSCKKSEKANEPILRLTFNQLQTKERTNERTNTRTNERTRDKLQDLSGETVRSKNDTQLQINDLKVHKQFQQNTKSKTCLLERFLSKQDLQKLNNRILRSCNEKHEN